jgi:hypothetical protein
MPPVALKATVIDRARQEGVSFGEYVRRALQKATAAGRGYSPDPLLDDKAVYRGRVPKNLAQHHDDHLYGGSAR